MEQTEDIQKSGEHKKKNQLCLYYKPELLRSINQRPGITSVDRQGNSDTTHCISIYSLCPFFQSSAKHLWKILK